MSNGGKVLIEETNIISLRTACVVEVEGCVALQLMPAPSSMAEKQNAYKREFVEWLRSYQTFLYRLMPSASEIVDNHIKQLAFEKSPELNLLWTESGNSVAVYLNGEPWAFIDEKTKKAYSKGILNSNVGTPWSFNSRGGTHWDQQVFEGTFMDAD
jgi:hypothetical protein